MDNKIIIDVPEFENGDSYSLSQIHNDEGWPVAQGAPTQDVNICQSGNQTANCLTLEKSELPSQVPNTEQFCALDDDFPNLPPLDESIIESLSEVEPETGNYNSEIQDMIDNENNINDFPSGSGAIGPGQNYLGFAEPAGLNEVYELARASTEQLEPDCIGWNAPIFSTNIMDWGIPQQKREPPHRTCHSCPIFRRIIHSNGIQESRLEIHGLHGKPDPDHVVAECRSCVPDQKQPRMKTEKFVFKNPDEIKEFITTYNHRRRLEGSVLRHDTITATESGRPAWGINPSVFQNNAVKKPANPSYSPKIDYSEQRKRTKTTEFTQLAECFGMTMAEAAKKIRMCPSAIKKICRLYDLPRWPFRKIRSINTNIQSLESKLVGRNGEINERKKGQIKGLLNEKENLYKQGLQGSIVPAKCRQGRLIMHQQVL